MLLRKAVLGAVAVAAFATSAAFATVPAQTNTCNYQFNTNLRLGAVSQDVQNLQKLLNMDAATRVAASGAGSAGLETFRFGPATLAAVRKFQAANGISPVSGYVGPLTRATLNTICSSTVSTTPTTNTGSGVVSNNIPVSVLVEGQAGAKLGEFVVSGNGTVTQLELMRTGLSSNSTLRNVYLFDGNTRITDGSSVLTDGTIRFSAGSGLFMVNGSKTITVRADICKSTISGCPSSTSGQTVGVAMKSVTMMGGTSTPVTGANGPLFSISSASTVTANFPTATPNPAATSINAGSMNQILWSNSVSIGTNPAKFHGITLKQIGSAPVNTLTNAKLYIDGVERGMATINNMNQFVFNMSGNPVMLTTGSHLIEFRADVVAGAQRNFYISLERGTDLMIEDSTLPGINVGVTSAGNDLVNMNAGQISVNQGSLTITQDTSFNNTTNIVGGASNVTLGKWKMTSYGEDVKVTSLNFTVSQSLTPVGTQIANVALYVNGGQVGSSINPGTFASGFNFTGLGSSLYIPAGQNVTVEVRADTMNASSVAYTGGSIQLTMAAGTNNAQGISSSQTFNTSSSGGQTLTISNNVTFGSTAGFGTSTKAPNTQGVKIGSFSIQTGSAEGITVNNISVTLPAGAGNTMQPANQLTNLTIKDGSTVVGTPIGNPVITSSNAFSAQIVVPQSSTKVFDVYADFGSGSALQTVTPSMAITYRGNTSNQSNTTSVVAGVQTTAGVASIATTGVTFDSGSSLSARAVVAGQSTFAVGTFKITANTAVAGAVVKDVTIEVPANTATAVTIAGKTANFITSGATSTAVVYNVGINVPANPTTITMPITLALTCVGTPNGCASNSPLSVYAGVRTLTYNDGNTVQTLSFTNAPVTNVHTMYGGVPVVTVNTTQATGLNYANAVNKVGEFTVAADTKDVVVTQMVFDVNGTNFSAATLATPFVAEGVSGSTAISGSSCTPSGATSIVTTNTVTCTFTGGYTIPAGTSKVFSLRGTVSGTAVASTIQSISSKMTSAGFMWNDTFGNSTGNTGANIFNFPSDSYSIRQ